MEDAPAVEGPPPVEGSSPVEQGSRVEGSSPAKGSPPVEGSSPVIVGSSPVIVGSPPVEGSTEEWSPVEYSRVEWYQVEDTPVEGSPVEVSQAPVQVSPVEPAEGSQQVEWSRVQRSPAVEWAPLEYSPTEYSRVEGSPPVEGSTGTVMSVIIVDHEGNQRKRRISSDIGFQNTLTSLHVSWLVDKDSYEIADFGSLKDGETYTFPTLQQQQQQELAPPPVPSPSPGLLSQCNYKYGAGNGVDPKNFRSMPVATDVLNKLPRTFSDIQKDKTVARVLLHGSPGSGKTSILGHIYTRLQARYQDVPVYFVRSTEFNLQRNRIIEEIGEIPECVVILDDAHNWYADENFFGLFKSTHRILVAGANYVVPSENAIGPVDFQVKCNIARANV